MLTKEDLRKQMIIVRKNIQNKNKLSTVIVNKIFDLDIYQKSKTIALYNSLKSEVDTSILISELVNKVILLPKVINNKIIFVKIDKNTKYKKSRIGVLEPIGNEYLGNIDLIIVPGVAFDKKKNRLGFGMGYYDRYLNNKNIYKIGICFHEQLLDDIPNEIHDIKMDLILTEKEFIN